MKRTLMATVAAGFLVAGCGGSDEDQVAEPVKTYLSALADGDAERACDQLTGSAQRELVAGLAETLPEAGLLTCEAAIEQIAGSSDPMRPTRSRTPRSRSRSMAIAGSRDWSRAAMRSMS